MTPVYFFSLPGGNSTMEISQDELKSLLSEIETKLHQSKVYRHTLASLQNLSGLSSEQVRALFKAVGREAISATFQQFIQPHQKVVDNNQQVNNQIKGNREQGTLNSVGFGRGFDPVQNEPHIDAGVSDSQGLREILTKNGKQFVPYCSPFPVPCSLLGETPAIEQAEPIDLSACLTSVKGNQVSPATTTSKVDLPSKSHIVANTADHKVKLQNNSPTRKTSMRWLGKLDKKSKLAERAKMAAEQRLEILRQIGQQLRQAREFQGLSLSQLNVYTHVQISYMEAVENGNWELLPDEVFVRGYIRVMGNALGLDGTALAASLPAPKPVKSVLPSRYESKKISGSGMEIGLGLRPVHLYVGYTALMAGAVGGLSMVSQQVNADGLFHSQAVTPSSSSFNQSLQDKKPTTKPGLQSSRAGITVGSDISPPEVF